MEPFNGDLASPGSTRVASTLALWTGTAATGLSKQKTNQPLAEKGSALKQLR
jgi:hypothetical protein